MQLGFMMIDTFSSAFKPLKKKKKLIKSFNLRKKRKRNCKHAKIKKKCLKYEVTFSQF